MTNYELYLRALSEEELLEELDTIENSMCISIQQRGRMSQMQIRKKGQVKAEILRRMKYYLMHR
jgi:hypothetical protein